MAAGKGVADPGGVAGALRWNVPGTFRSDQGTWELVVKDDLMLRVDWTPADRRSGGSDYAGSLSPLVSLTGIAGSIQPSRRARSSARR